jgi:mannose/cellobiose epimerase-like protein (N-acyl-D-glucosamine 2-epimerase family)
MTDTMTSADIREVAGRFFGWLQNDALPLWSTKGVDGRGGFIEQLTPDGQIIADVRRARVVARQVFAFKSAGDLDWSGPVERLVQHGLDALLGQHLTNEGEVVPRYIPAHDRGEGEFDLYDHAFVLFGLANGFACTRDRRLEAMSLSILERMRAGWAQPHGGFAEHRPAQAPLKANPHMHLLEAALVWTGVSSDPAWRALAAEVVSLCLARFIDPATGCLHEYFDADWNTLAVGQEDVVEPGHQAEWAWLLLRWQKLQPTDGLKPAAARLMAIAEGEGLDRNQYRLINELNGDLSSRDRRLRLWPQTERIRALIAFQDLEADPERRANLEERLVEAVEGLLGYFDHPIAGSWWEHFDEHGQAVWEPARASSLYHIMGAANELARLTGLRLS